MDPITTSSISLIATLILIGVNVVAFIMVGVDKNKSVDLNRRVPEVYFFVWSIFFASAGVLLGMFVFRHKTRKLHFVLGLGVLLIEQILLLSLLLAKLSSM